MKRGSEGRNGGAREGECSEQSKPRQDIKSMVLLGKKYAKQLKERGKDTVSSKALTCLE